MKAFQYIVPATVEEAAAILGEYGSGAAVLAGGTDLMIGLRRPTAGTPSVLADVTRIPALDGIGDQGTMIRIGPLATHRRILQSDLIDNCAPFLATAAASVGSPQIRNRGTVGGNIMNAAACADTVPPLVALGATVTLRCVKGTRELALADLFIKPYQTSARPDELLTDITFKKLPPGARSAFVKLGRRNALSISRLSVAAILQTGPDGRITDARIVPGAAFPVWHRITEAETILIGEPPSEKLFKAAGERVSAVMISETGRRWSTEYKEPVIAVLVRRALEACVMPPAQHRIARHSSLPLPDRHLRPEKPLSPSSDGACSITVTVNGRRHDLNVPVNRTLLTMLREDMGLTGTKCGCEVGECGACTVILDGQAVNSCLVPAPQVHGRSVTTIEGLSRGGKLHPLQESFLDHDAAHCGFCTPGMLMSAKALLDENPGPTEQEIRAAVSGNLCRCTGYVQIVEAIADIPGRKIPDSPTSHQ